MKKLFCAIICIILITLCGCKTKSPEVTAITEGLEFTAEIEQNGQNYSFYAQIPERDIFIADILEPESLKDLSLEISGSSLTVSYKDIDYKTTLDALPKSSFVNRVCAVFADVQSSRPRVISKNDEFFIEGRLNSRKYKLCLGSTGLPLKIIFDDKDTVIINNAGMKKNEK